MNRRRLLALGGVTAPILLSGCVRPPLADGGSPSDGVSVEVISRADQPAVPVEYGVEAVASRATDDRPARLRVTITNRSEARIVLGEQRDVLFHHVASVDETLYLHPVGDGEDRGPVVPGCWRLTEYVAVPEYYGTVALQAGETVAAESFVYGHPDLPDGVCLPEGDHRIRTTGLAGDDEDLADGAGATEFGWGFTLRIGR